MVKFGVSSEKALVAMHCHYFEDSMTRVLALICHDECRTTNFFISKGCDPHFQWLPEFLQEYSTKSRNQSVLQDNQR